MKKKLILEEASPGPLSGKNETWRTYRIAGHMDRRRLEGPERIIAPSAYLARQRAAILFGELDPLAIDVVLDHGPNGAP